MSETWGACIALVIATVAVIVVVATVAVVVVVLVELCIERPH